MNAKAEIPLPVKPALLQVENLKKHFPIFGGVFSRQIGSVKAVEGVSFSIAEGETYGLVGESGCGKSTVGRTILSLISPTAGRVTFNDTLLYDVEEKKYLPGRDMRVLRRDMQIIFQDPFASLDPRMTIGSIVSEGLLAHRLATTREAMLQAEELLELCGISSQNINRYPHEFSGGQRQRISIARALAFHPKFVICDEPIAALDVSIQAQILTLMQDLKDRLNLTYLFISHDLGVVRYFCDLIAVMYLGSFVETGSSEQLFKNPVHPYTQALLSAMPALDSGMTRSRIILKGTVPNPANAPSGCRFHTRCIHSEQRCREDAPQMQEVEPGHLAACHLLASS